MKIKQNAPLRLKIQNTPTLLKPYSDKDTRVLLPTKTFERQLTNLKSDYPILIQSNATNIQAFNKTKNKEEEKKEDLIVNNDSGKSNHYEKLAKNKEAFVNASVSITMSLSKNIVNNRKKLLK